MQGFIFAAGLGTRLKPITDSMPKALVPIDGKPLLDIVAEKLVNSGCDRLIVNVHHFAELIYKHLDDTEYGVPVSVSDESDLLLDTGGAIKYASALIDDKCPFIAHNVDIISNLNIKEFYASHRSDALATLLVSDRKTKRYLLFNEEYRLVGWTNIETGEVKSPYESLDVDKCKKRAFAGIHVISPKVTVLMEDMPDKFSIIDFYLNMAHRHPIYGYETDNLRVIDVGKLDSLDTATEMYREFVK